MLFIACPFFRGAVLIRRDVTHNDSSGPPVLPCHCSDCYCARADPRQAGACERVSALPRAQRRGAQLQPYIVLVNKCCVLSHLARPFVMILGQQKVYYPSVTLFVLRYHLLFPFLLESSLPTRTCLFGTPLLTHGSCCSRTTTWRSSWSASARRTLRARASTCVARLGPAGTMSLQASVGEGSGVLLRSHDRYLANETDIEFLLF